MSTGLMFALITSLIALGYGIITISSLMKKSPGNEEMQRISLAIQEGASAYLKRQYIAIGVVGVVLAISIAIFLPMETAIGFTIGAVFSGLAGFIGMNVSVRSNARTAEAARDGLNAGLQVAFKGGAITGMLVVGLGLLGVAGYYMILKQMGYDDTNALHSLIGLASVAR